MDPLTQSNDSHKTSIIITLTIVFLVAVLATIYFIQKEKPPEFSEAPTPNPIEVPVSSAEKLRILGELASSTPVISPAEQKEKMKILENLAKKVPPPTASTTSEKLKLLESLSATAGQ